MLYFLLEHAHFPGMFESDDFFLSVVRLDYIFSSLVWSFDGILKNKYNFFCKLLLFFI